MLLFKSRIWIGMIMITLITGVLTGCGNTASNESSGAKEKLQVYASLYPLAFLAEEVGKEQVEVHNLVPPGVESHDYEPTAKDLATMQEADLLLINGVGFEGWVDKAQPMLKKNGTSVVDTSKSIQLLLFDEEHDYHHEDGHGNEHDHGEYDPHVWLNPLNAKKQAETIRDAFIKKDPKHQKEYETNYEKLADRLEKLDQKLMKIAKNSKSNTIVVSHASFGYLADRYDLKQVAVSGLSPSSEPSAKKLKEVVEVAKKNKVSTIYFEALVTNKVANTVKKEVGARSLTLNPLEGLTSEQHSKGEDYFTIMEQNGENLKIGLNG